MLAMKIIKADRYAGRCLGFCPAGFLRKIDVRQKEKDQRQCESAKISVKASLGSQKSSIIKGQSSKCSDDSSK